MLHLISKDRTDTFHKYDNQLDKNYTIRVLPLFKMDISKKGTSTMVETPFKGNNYHSNFKVELV